ncbi:MAG: glycosyltransferase [Alloprevotella sp.]|nr:glycosyltransferase [Alloprevotella sp.]
MPTVSIVIPAYNMEAYLAETLESVLASDYSGGLEVIVVNDGSTDDTERIARSFAERDSRIHLINAPNGGACRARNRGISESRGKYIFPVDADNTIEPWLVSALAEVIEQDESIKVVCPRADFFGDRSGEWKLPDFRLRLLARKNMIDTCAMFRRTDWERVGGYQEEIPTREDWVFWISVLKDGGRVVRLPRIGFHYRIRSNSKRVTRRNRLPEVIRSLNRLYPDFYERELRGPLRQHRTWSRLLNTLHRLCHPRRWRVAKGYENLSYHIKSLPAQFHFGAGEVIYKGRNELRRFEWQGERFIVKSFQIPHLWGRLIYGWLRPSKARRSFDYAARLRGMGIGSPEPIGWLTERSGLLFTRSYYVCRESELPHTYANLIDNYTTADAPVLRAIGRMNAQLHEAGMIHRDFSRGNILYRLHKDGHVDMELIDLNRLRFHPVSMEEGKKNFERLPMTEEMWQETWTSYRQERENIREGVVSPVLPASKSIANRALILNALVKEKRELRNLSDADDTRVLLRALETDAETVDIGAAGTAMRFLTAYFALMPGTRTLTGTERMKQRPIGILVDALRELGADIQYVQKEGFPPLRITGRKLHGATLRLPANISSQYISALLMITPHVDGEVKLELEGAVTSAPYIDMTRRMAAAWKSGEAVAYEIEADWSAASYWYEIVALSKQPDLRLHLRGLKQDSLQGDCRVSGFFFPLGVQTEYVDDGVVISQGKADSTPLHLDLSQQPDLAQTLIVTCGLLGRPFRFTGLQSLRIKETDRIAALTQELAKFGVCLRVEDSAEEGLTVSADGDIAAPVGETTSVATYDDHRMAMSFAPTMLLFPNVTIEHPEVVSKSYPRFWEEFHTIFKP